MPDTLTYQLFINGDWVGAESGEVSEVRNPANGRLVGTVAQASRADAVRAIAAARAAFDEGPWPRMTPAQRCAVLLRLTEALERRRDEIVDLVIAEAGSTRQLAGPLHVDVPLHHLRDLLERVVPAFPFQEAMLPILGAGIGQGVVVREPVGVTALITPFNFPFFLNIFKLAPALAAGCTAILKPAPLTPLEAFLIGECADEAGLPAGVLNIVTGDVEASTELTRNPMVDMVSFTGSDTVGRQVMSQAADTLKKVVLELGGKSANIVLADAELDRVIPDIVANMTIHAGQGCALLTRTLVHESVLDVVTSRLTDALAAVRIGDPDSLGTAMGPLISEHQRGRVEHVIQTGVEQGATLAYGGGRPAGIREGYFIEPTLFVNVDNSMPIAREEIFGPVGVIIPFRDDDEAVKLANDNDFGLSGGVWSADPIRAFAIAQRLRTGNVLINGGGGGMSPHGPFGGYKQSGLGREWGHYGLSEYLEYKTITWSIR